MNIFYGLKRRLLYVLGILFFMFGVAFFQEKSQYQVACEKLGFVLQKEQAAVLHLFSMAGYLSSTMLWSAVYRSGIFGDPEKVFKEAVYTFQNCSIERAVKALFQGPRYSDEQVARLLLYMSQTAFDRKPGQERNELDKKNWMEQYEEEYIEQAKVLGMYDAILPDRDWYDAVFVFGASRPGLYPRLIELNHYIQQGLRAGQIFILTGQRELWAEIDGVSPAVMEIWNRARDSGISMDDVDVSWLRKSSDEKNQEGERYLQELAQKFGVAYDQDYPIVKRNNRSYLNVVDQQEKVTETTMALDLLSCFPEINFHLIDDDVKQNGDRPDTVSTAQNVTKLFLKNICEQDHAKKEFHILAVSNNPYIKRQTIAVQRVVNQALKEEGLDVKIYIHGVGFRARRDVSVMHSDFGAYMSELFRDAYPESDTKMLMFRTRDNSIEVPSVPS